MFDPRQFDPAGNILPNAPAQAERNKPLPPGSSKSGLFAFFTRTFLGLQPTECSFSVRGLRLYASPGRAIIFNMDTDHQGWKTSDLLTRPSDCGELSVHIRAHYYMYSKDMRYLPTSDMEESFEVMACVAQGTLDAAKKMVVLDALQTFVDECKPADRDYTSFKDQGELDMHCCDEKNGCDVFGSKRRKIN
jgi:hypothetical protein